VKTRPSTHECPKIVKTDWTDIAVYYLLFMEMLEAISKLQDLKYGGKIRYGKGRK
jgi:hypothetical protein